jgi:hypothetical protein
MDWKEHAFQKEAFVTDFSDQGSLHGDAEANDEKS